jgi:hypothetical protein
MTVEQAPSVTLSFDLADLQVELESILVGRRRASLAAVVFAIGLAVVLMVVSIRPLENHTLGSTAFAALIILVGALLLGAVLISPTRANLKSGATRLEIDREGFTLIYPKGRTTRNNWKDSFLKFDLIDTSPMGRLSRLVAAPYSISVDGVRSLLPPSAYQALAHEVEERGLLSIEGSQSRLLYDAGSSPRVTRVRQGGARRVRPRPPVHKPWSRS